MTPVSASQARFQCVTRQWLSITKVATGPPATISRAAARLPAQQFCFLAFCDVLQRFDATDHLAVGIADRRGGERQPATFAGEVREEILRLPAAVAVLGRPVLATIELLEQVARRAVDDEIGQYRAMGGIERPPLMMGTEHFRSRNAGHAGRASFQYTMTWLESITKVGTGLPSRMRAASSSAASVMDLPWSSDF